MGLFIYISGVIVAAVISIIFVKRMIKDMVVAWDDLLLHFGVFSLLSWLAVFIICVLAIVSHFYSKNQ